MKIFYLKNENGEEFLAYGTTLGETAEGLGISPYLFKKEGWEAIDPENRKLFMGFIFSSKGEPWSEKSTKHVIRGPFTEKELTKRIKADQESWRQNVNQGRADQGSTVKAENDEKPSRIVPRGTKRRIKRKGS